MLPPVLLARWKSLEPRGRAAAVAVGAIVTIAGPLTLFREGAFGEALTVDLSKYESKSRWQISSNHGTSSTTTGSAPPSFSGKKTSCAIECSGDVDVCAGLQTAFFCDADREPAVQAGPAVHLTGNVTFADAPLCYVPLYKDGEVSFHAALSANTRDAQGQKSGSYSASGSVEQEMTGVASCLRYKRELGRQAGVAMAENVSGFLKAN